MSASAASEKAEGAEQKKYDELLLFCVRCFASEKDGSWGETVYESMCSNCGAGGPPFRIPGWAVDSIRENASWVGKRYYPADEDHEQNAEVQELRKLVKKFPGRTCEPTFDGQAYQVTQEMPNGSTTSMFTGAATAKKAMEDLKLDLPYVSEAQLKAGRKAEKAKKAKK